MSLYYGNYTKSSRRKVADEEPWQKFNMRYLPLQTRVGKGHVSLASLTGDRSDSATRNRGEMQKQKERQTQNSPQKSVLPAHVEDWRREEAQGMLKHFRRTHKKFVQWVPIGQKFFRRWWLHFYYQHLKRCRSPQASMCNPPPHLCFFSLQCLLMTRMPVCNSLNNYRQDRGKKQRTSDEMWIS